MLFSVSGREAYTNIFGRGKPGGIETSEINAERYWSDVMTEARSGKYHTLVLSSEYAFGLTPAALARLVEKMKSFSDQVELVGYLRSPASHYASGMQQTLKYGAKIKNPMVPKKYHMLYRKVKQLHCNKVTVKPFDRKKFFNECIVQDFLKTSVGFSDADIAPVNVINDNESVSSPALRVLYEFNNVFFKKSRRPGNPLSTALLSVISQIEAEQNYSKPKLRPSVRTMIENINRQNMQILKTESGIVLDDFNYTGHIPSQDEIDESPLNSEDLVPEEIYTIDPYEVNDLRARVLHSLLTRNKGLSFEDVNTHVED